MVTNIPKELQTLDQWVCHKTTKNGLNKIPLNPLNGKYASVSDPTTWGRFDDALRHQPVGFVLTDSDPYTIIDLDDPSDQCQEKGHKNIIKMLSSYTELSYSGKGVHIIVKGKLWSSYHKNNVEAYSNNKCMICTGNTIGDRSIMDRQTILDELFTLISTIPVHPRTVKAVIDDSVVIDKCLDAKNSAKFTALCNGDWYGTYASQSEADFALLSIISFYTDDNNQIKKIFRMSKLGQREKATKDDKYLDLSLNKIRLGKKKLVITGSLLEYGSVPSKDVQDADCNATTRPPGLLGDIAQYIYESSIRPVKEIGLIAAIGLMTGICGRSYNISGTGLNQYLVLLSGTGTGKDGIKAGIDRLMMSVRDDVTVCDIIGPSGFASGQALIRHLDSTNCFVSILGEFSIILGQMLDNKAFGPIVMLRRALLDIYGKSGCSNILQPNVYSDSSKNTKFVRAPSLSIIGETTPTSFFEAVNSDHILDGLLPRFSIIEYKGLRPSRNKDSNWVPNQKLISDFKYLINTVKNLKTNNNFLHVKTDSVATKALDDFDLMCDNYINIGKNESISQLWNRAHLKALKLSALISVGVNPNNPTIRIEDAKWAIDFVKKDVSVLLNRFDDGDIGDGNQKQEFDARNAIASYLDMTTEQRRKYRVPIGLTDLDIIPYTFLRRKLKTLTSFRVDNKGSTNAIISILSDMVRGEVLVEIDKDYALKEYKTKSPIYKIGQSW